MGSKTGISWTDATWNPTTGCTKVSAGCDHCYAELVALAMQRRGVAKYADGFAVRTHDDALPLPLRWRQPKRIFVNSMSDLFHKDIPPDFVDRVFAVMTLADWHTFQVLTKRPQRMANYLRDPQTPARIAAHVAALAARPRARGRPPALGDRWPLPNVWLGTSVEQQHEAHRIDPLLQCPAALHFLSCEPLLGALNLDRFLWADGGAARQPRPGWVIVGGESGPDFRPLDPAWAAALRDQCVQAGIPFFYKQGAAYRSGQHAVLDGVVWQQCPPHATSSTEVTHVR